jgi:hypothetical protein
MHCWRVVYGGDEFYLAAETTNPGPACFTIERQPPTIDLLSNPSGEGAPPGVEATASAALSGSPGQQVPTGSVTFFLCGPAEVQEEGCPAGAGSQVGEAVALSSGVASSGPAAGASEEGTHCWRARYHGDTFYQEGEATDNATACFTVEAAPPPQRIEPLAEESALDFGILARLRRTGAAPGDLAAAVGALSADGPAPTGTLAFFLCAPHEVMEAGCPEGAGAQVGAAIVLAHGTGASGGTSSTLEEGEYCWRLRYDGDSTYPAVEFSDRDRSCFIVGRLAAEARAASSPEGDGALPGMLAIHVLRLQGPPGVPAPTGEVTFYLCGPADNTTGGCRGGGQVGEPVAVSAGSAQSSAASATREYGQYCWRADYRGDSVYQRLERTDARDACFTVGVPTALDATPVLARVSLAGLQVEASSTELVATLAERVHGRPLVGSEVRFVAGATQLCTSTTDGEGVARCSLLEPRILVAVAEAQGYEARFDGDSRYGPSSSDAPLVLLETEGLPQLNDVPPL